MSEAYDEDELAALENHGILGGKALDQYEQVREKMEADGVKVTMSCRWCGKPSQVTLEWPELFFVGANGANQPLLVPPGWAFSSYNQSLYVALRCSQCTNGAGSQDAQPGLSVHMTPDEARRNFTTALQRGFVSKDQANQLKLQVAQVLAQQR
jgi:hypothetical protein